jgi:protein-tyrosine phosphatase
MAAGLLRRLFARSGVGASVGSAGLLPGGSPATDDAIATMAARNIDIRRHVSRALDAESASATPLVIGMTRHHVREACATYGAPVERTFTLKELVRRGERVEPRAEGESVPAWLARVGAGRSTAELVGDDPDDDIADPVGRPRAAYEQTADELEELLRRLVDLLIGVPPGSAAYAEPARTRRRVIGRGDAYAGDSSTDYSWR